MKKNNTFYSILAGLLLGIGVVGSWFWISTIVGIALLVSLIFQSRSFTQAFLIGFLAWTSKNLVTLSWFWSSYPVTLLPDQAPLIQLILIGVYWLTASIWLGLGGAGLGLIRWQWFKTRPIAILLVLPSVWVALEIVSSYTFSLMTQGAHNGTNIFFSFGYAGYAIAVHDTFLALGSFYGVYSLTWICAFLAMLLLLFLKASIPNAKKYSILSVVFVALLLTSNLSLFDQVSTDRSYTVAVIETQLKHISNTGQHTNRFLRYDSVKDALFEDLAQYEPTHILFPEDHNFFGNSPNTDTTKESLQEVFPKTVLVDSGTFVMSPGMILQATLHDTEYNTDTLVDKQYLVPQGEYTPTLYGNTLRLLGYGHMVDSVSQRIAYLPGPQRDQKALTNTMPGVLFCFESVSPVGVRSILHGRMDAPFIAHPISHAWFQNSLFLEHQLDTMLRIQAVWNNVPIVSAGNHAASKVYLPNGNIITTSDMLHVTSEQHFDIFVVEI